MNRVRTVRKRTDDWLVDLDEGRQTAATSIAAPTIAADATRVVAAILTTEVDELRHRVKTLSVGIDQTHQRTYLHEWGVLTQERTARSTTDMLSELADLGFAWRDIGRLVGVSIPAVQKWRKGERTSPDNRHRLASLLAGCGLIVRHRSVDDIGQWFEMPLVQGIPVTPIDLWAAGEYPLVFDYAMQHMTAEDILDRFDPEWRERYQSDFETFTAGDGELSIRVKER